MLYIYKRKTLLNSVIEFAEYVRFEDADFVLKYTAFALFARFVPLVLVYYVVQKNETSIIGNDKEKIKEFMMLDYRCAIAAEKERQKDVKTGQAMMKHAVFLRYAALKRYLWRLPYKEIRRILQDYQYPCKSGDALVDFTNQHTDIAAFILTILKPLFYIFVTIKKLVNNQLFTK